jgi:hypothetical protein
MTHQLGVEKIFFCRSSLEIMPMQFHLDFLVTSLKVEDHVLLWTR